MLSLARRDSKKYITSGGFEEDLTMTTPGGGTSIEITGFVSKHWINFETDGSAVNSKNAHICIDEDLLVSMSYPVRNSEKEVDLFKHRVTTKDSSGIDKNYVIKEWFADETLGLITCILSDYDDGSNN